MAGCDFRHQIDAGKAQKAMFSETEKEGLHASTVVGNPGRAQKTADETAQKQNGRQKRGKMEIAWQDMIPEAKVTPQRCKKQGFQRRRGKANVPDL